MKLGLCLSGGGARGAYQIGACMALKEAGIFDRIEAFSGTSIGAVNAAMLATLPLEEIKELWFDLPEETLMKTEGFFRRMLEEKTDFLKNGLFRINQLKQLINEHLNMKSLKQQRVYVTMAESGEAKSGLTALLKNAFKHYLGNDNHAIYVPLWKQTKAQAVEQIIASCSIPIVFPAQNIDGKQYFDGGVYDNVPVKPLIDEGCDTIIVIHLDHLPYLYRSRYKETTFHAIKPKHLLGMRLNFDIDKTKRRYQYGYDDTVKFLKENKII